MPAPSPPVDHGSSARRFFSDPKTGELAIAQWPNAPLAIFLVASIANRVVHPDGRLGTAMGIVAGVSLVWWSVDEILRGDSPFRRVLGAVVLFSFALGLLLR